MGGGGFDDRMGALRERLRSSQAQASACAHDYEVIAQSRGGLIPDEMLSGKAGETGEQLRKSLAREERLAHELDLAKATGARALEREQESMYVRLRQQEIHSTLLSAAHDAANASSHSLRHEVLQLRSKAELLESRLKELLARSHEDAQLERWDLELARRERDAARAHAEHASLRAHELTMRVQAEEPTAGADASAAIAGPRGWDFSDVQPELRLVRAGVARMGEALGEGPVEDHWHKKFRGHLARVEAALEDLAVAR
ncbi:hypothetical protein T492DRAFT_939725 [Pavlovales sp. CCMP2436]|nr:hypothetical protein T492DRAFT_939725 [Pavlovales sp. CCMP2436]